MPGIPSPFGGDDGATFEPEDEWTPAVIPDPGPFLTDHEVLTGAVHLDFHRTTRDLFEERGVYDVTFGYNLARLNEDTRHPDAGYRYAVHAEDDGVLLAEFTPTTAFCPQSDTLTRASFRAWNGLADRHAFDVVRVRVAPMHNEADAINDRLRELGATFEDEGVLPGAPPDGGQGRPDDRRAGDDRTGDDRIGDGAPDGPSTPF